MEERIAEEESRNGMKMTSNESSVTSGSRQATFSIKKVGLPVERKQLTPGPIVGDSFLLRKSV